MTIEDIDRTAAFVDDRHDEVIIKVVGVGGGGNNAVNHMYKQGIKQVSFVVCNTDRQALNDSPVPNRLLIGPNTTHGLGAGADPELARLAAEESAEDIERIFDDETRMVFITAGMGGGTGTGAAPVVARIAREKGLLTIGIVTIPFLFEGEKKILKALNGAEELSKHVDALLVVNNEMLTEIYPDLNWINGFAKADDTLTNAARSISELITCTGRINLDFNDVNKTLSNGGAAIISTGYGEGEHRVTKAIEDALNSPLLRNRDVFSSKRLLFNLYFAPEHENALRMSEANELTSFISNIDGVDVIYGIGFDDSLGDKIKITILAAGFELSIKDDLVFDPKKGQNGGGTIQRGPKAAPQSSSANDTVDIASAYGAEKAGEIAKAKDAARYIIMRPEQFADLEVIERFEQAPAYNRDRKVADSVRNAGAAQPTSPAAADAAAPAADDLVSSPSADRLSPSASDLDSTPDTSASGPKVIDF